MKKIIFKPNQKMSKEEKLNINIVLTDESGLIVKGKSAVTLESYNHMKEFHNLSILDETLEMMLEQLNQTQMNKEQAKDTLIQLLTAQVMDLTMMSKIELGDDVIEEIKRLNQIINQNADE